MLRIFFLTFNSQLAKLTSNSFSSNLELQAHPGSYACLLFHSCNQGPHLVVGHCSEKMRPIVGDWMHSCILRHTARPGCVTLDSNQGPRDLSRKSIAFQRRL